MSNPVMVLILLLAALFLAACGADGDVQTASAPPKDNGEGNKVSKSDSVAGSAGETPQVNRSAAVETETATFALG
jgi:hypothetical protein